MKRVVVGTDGSPAALAAIGEALREATARHASLDVVAVHATQEDEGVVAARARRQLIAAQAGTPEGAKVVVGIRTVPGSPAEQLTAAAVGAELLVVGTHSPAGLFASSVTKACIRDSGVAVLVVPPAPDVAVPRDGGVLAAVDLSPDAEVVIIEAAREARARKEKLTVLHVMTAEVASLTAMAPMALAYVQEDRKAVDESELGRRLAALDLADLGPDLRVVGGPEWGLLESLTQRTSVLVIGSRRLPSWRELLGRTSNHVTRHAHGPVLVVPSRQAADRNAAGLAAVVPTP